MIEYGDLLVYLTLFSIIKSVLISSAISILGVFMIMGNIDFPDQFYYSFNF